MSDDLIGRKALIEKLEEWCDKQKCLISEETVEFVEIEVLDEGWFLPEHHTDPRDKELCIAINKITGIPMIGIYLENISIDRYHAEISKCFFDVIEAMKFYVIHRSEAPILLPMENVNYWKPLLLPADANERIFTELKKWFV